MTDGTSGAAGGAWRATIAAALGYGLLGLWATWPLGLHLRDHVVDTVAVHGPFGWLALADILLVIWALAWDVHALGSAPLALFDANVFHPAPGSLLRADHFLGSLPLFAPPYLATGNPVLAHQTALLLCLPLSALAMFVAVRVWTANDRAAFVAGLLFGFAPWRLTQLAHLQTQATIYLPLVLLLAWWVVVHGGARAWVTLVGTAGLQALSSVYLALATLVVATAMAAGAWLGARSGRAVVGVLGVLALVIALGALAALPYLGLAMDGSLPGHAPARGGGAGLATLGANPLGTWILPSRPPSTDGYYDLGFAGVGLALLGALAGARGAPPGVWGGLILVLGAGWVVALGYARTLPGGTEITLPLGWLAAAVPGMGAFRAPVRFGLIVALAAAALGGVAWGRVEHRVTRRRRGLVVVVTALALVPLAGIRVPLREVPVADRVPEVYRWLAAAPRGPVLEVPIGIVEEDFRADGHAARWQSTYQYLSTVHWQPLLGGYSAHPPGSYFLVMALARRLPDGDALADLVDLTGVRWVVVHRAALDGRARRAWVPSVLPSGLVHRERFDQDDVYEVSRPVRRDLRAGLVRSRPGGRTLGGVTRAPLEPDTVAGRLDDLEIVPTAPTGVPLEGWVTVENTGTRAWPGLDPWRRGLVGIGHRWRANGEAVSGTVTSRLGRDLAPGERVRVPFTVITPARPGDYRLEVALRQDERWLGGAGGPRAKREMSISAWPAARGDGGDG